ncbi:UDP-N-acetylmuramoyl-L-alanyl-D-glutamate--2,6-diaminopimelate ligase [Croceicoccus sp. F390]|uniref:UDP-N-acetylmuramoyl-L-alanyl-D-glutamate--2,6-diaminopimelate ligase n=1 Tax=Croceicoccus esteveae TaxID=3075597 RepID=A0ABU2ZJT6_9SPHN|nr:UDP-N-acetylmuramoyl-L-alanyl-D-glutamate--2,6-diaminopimelate ligase [Croceicoccus sp. F390]MDT0575657.1 UDP-N-acetylmuramoyl-L-alanyl-D-glutamate--2,6-diaminopimelate ligase [Croceicoccus sp. F390]
MRLATLLQAAGMAPVGDGAVTGFAIDHRKVSAGSVFGAFVGNSANGEEFVPAAVAAGAVAVVARPHVKVDGAVHIAALHPRRAFARLAAGFFTPVPATIVAVTGTNGKTSTVELTRQIWRMCGFSAASIGTLGVTAFDESTATGLTTPDVVTFLSNLAGLSREGVTHVAYEASSHGLSQHRNEGPTVSAGAFTSFSRDHLDYHATMEDYFEAKMRLVDEVVDQNGAVVVWMDDPYSPEVARRARGRGLRLFAVGENGDAERGIRLLSHAASALGQDITVAHAGQEIAVRLPLIGRYQAANALCAAGLVLATAGPDGPSAAQVFDAMARLQPVRGRLERAVISRTGAPVYVDYAHTPEALIAVMTTLRSHVEGRLIVIFGAGGDRDEGKRRAMGEAVAQIADIAIVTDDNPRGEDPAAIRAAVLEGFHDTDNAGGKVDEISDRRAAIAAAISMAAAGDIVLIAGKGHEQGQIVGRGDAARVHPFDDVAVARECAA